MLPVGIPTDRKLKFVKGKINSPVTIEKKEIFAEKMQQIFFFLI